jgi:hypothetical protein
VVEQHVRDLVERLLALGWRQGLAVIVELDRVQRTAQPYLAEGEPEQREALRSRVSRQGSFSLSSIPSRASVISSVSGIASPPLIEPRDLARVVGRVVVGWWLSRRRVAGAIARRRAARHRRRDAVSGRVARRRPIFLAARIS